MAKSSGITSTLSVDDSAGALKDLSNDILSFNISTPRGSVDITGLDKSAIERLQLLADANYSLVMAFNPTATTGQHAVFRTMSSSTVARTVTLVINSTPTATLSMEMLCSEYSLARAADGSLQATASLALSNGAAPTWS